ETPRLSLGFSMAGHTSQEALFEARWITKKTGTQILSIGVFTYPSTRLLLFINFPHYNPFLPSLKEHTLLGYDG
ncbi:MAG TPA: hypothetical protein PKY68_09165, partial [Bacteroidales bacterium]|nr:hypothetical protein [Bacteroidales bacterium]